MEITALMKNKALQWGASGAKGIEPASICVQDEIIKLCEPPRCEGYGQSVNCPPHAMKPAEARAWIETFQAAVLFKIDTTPEVLLSEKGVKVFRKIYDIASRLEALARDRGYLHSQGLAAGSCKAVFCKREPCEAMKESGVCRFPDLARPSMEALGINVFKLVRRAGWEIHSMGRDSKPADVPSALLAGLVLVG